MLRQCLVFVETDFPLERHSALQRLIQTHCLSLEVRKVLIAPVDRDAIVGGPGDTETRIVPAISALTIGSVNLRHLVEDLAGRFEGLEAVRKTFRNIQQETIILRQFFADPLFEGRRLRTQIDDYIQDGAFRAPD